MHPTIKNLLAIVLIHIKVVLSIMRSLKYVIKGYPKKKKYLIKGSFPNTFTHLFLAACIENNSFINI